VLAQGENFIGLARRNQALIAKLGAIDSPQRMVLDVESTEIPVVNSRRTAPHAGTSNPPATTLLFNGQGDCLAAKRSPERVHSADGWETMLLPEIELQQKVGKEAVFRADATFANPETCETIGGAGAKPRHPHPAQREHGEGHRGTVDPFGGLPSRMPTILCKSFQYQAASWKTALRVLAKVKFHCSELFPRVGFILTNLKTDSRVVVRLYNKRGAADQARTL